MIARIARALTMLLVLALPAPQAAAQTPGSGHVAHAEFHY